MTHDHLLDIDGAVRVPRSELTYRASRSGGPGGQHVNTSATRVELTWNVVSSTSLTDEQRARLLERLANRIDSSGTLRLTASSNRSQLRNREEVTERFRRLVAAALRQPKRRKRTRVPRAAREARLREKRRRAQVKRTRQRVQEDE